MPAIDVAITMTKLRQLLGDGLRHLKLVGRRDDAAEVLRHFHLLRLPKRQAGSIRWRDRPVQYVDGPALYYQIADIYAERVYDFACPQPNPRILDVGGHIGLATLRFRELFPGARITAFEPDPSICACLRNNLRAWHDSQTEVVEAAAWTAEGPLSFSSAGDDSGAILAAGSLQVAGVDLARYCATPVDYLKLDVEGAEFDIIAHLQAQGVLPQIQRMCIEMHIWDPTVPRFHELLGCLADSGFNYRLRSVSAHGALATSGGFGALPYPANLVVLYAWRETASVVR